MPETFIAALFAFTLPAAGVRCGPSRVDVCAELGRVLPLGSEGGTVGRSATGCPR